MDIDAALRQRRQGAAHPPRIMGILNTTPDSFSDGGVWVNVDDAVRQAEEMAHAGAAYIDIGGESTRPGATPVGLDTERARALPVITAVCRAGHAVVSVDTMKSEIARQALSVGAGVVNDVSGGFADPRMLSVIAESDAQFVLGHWLRFLPNELRENRATSEVQAVIAELGRAIDHALAAGIRSSQLLIDPGIGFGKTPATCWRLLTELDEIGRLGFPLVVGCSRKRFLGAALTRGCAERKPVDRDFASTALHAIVSFTSTVEVLRVHNVAAAHDAMAVTNAWQTTFTDLVAQPGFAS